MFAPDEYELIDFGELQGHGRKLERIGGVRVSRPSPAADGKKLSNPKAWKEADLVFRFAAKKPGTSGSPGSALPATGTTPSRGKWTASNRPPDPWIVRCDSFSMKLKPTPFGHVGLFAEQAENWGWIRNRVQRANRPVSVLNLFAYTGGSTLAAASAGANVVHVDSAKNIVNWARENAALSDLDQHPVRWIVEDCLRFVYREVKRGNRYDAIILDPPSFGHGPKGEVWKIHQHLGELLRNCRELLSDEPEFFLLTCHSPGLGPADLSAMVGDSIFGTCSTRIDARPLFLRASDGRRLNAGNLVRWHR